MRPTLEKIEKSTDIDHIEKVKMAKSVELIGTLQEIFTKMILSKVSYQDPTSVLEAVVDDNGKSINIYE